MLFKKTILSITALFMTASGMPVYAEQAPTPEVTAQKDDTSSSTETGSVLGIKKLYAEEPETLTTGNKFNEAIKTLAAGAAKSFTATDSLIQSIQVTDAVPSDASTVDVSADGDGSYLAWWDADAKTIYLYSKSGDIVLNPDSGNMFYNCTSLATLDVSGWNTSKVTTMNSMFYYCSSLTTLDMSRWNTGSVTNMSYMFRYCSNLTTLDLSIWDTRQVTSMGSVFYGCNNLATLDLFGWNTSKVTSMNRMFEGCSKLTTIYIGPNWNIDNVTYSSRMFTGCSNLPNFNSNVVDKTNANADPDTGYMTYKVEALKYLKDSSFVLSGTSDYGNSVNMVVPSDKNGMMPFKNLEKGTYTLTEVSPTDGYIKNSGKYTVTVTDSGVSVVSDNPDFYYETEDQKVLFNEPYHSFTIQKTSSVDSTTGVEGAEFLLSGVSDYGTEVSQPQTTGKTGVATFDHLEAGSYLLTETKAPEHFALDPISRIVTINKYGVVKIDGLSKEGSSFVWTDIRNADGTITITKNWKDTLTGTAAANRALPIIVISDQRTIPDAIKITYYAGSGYFGTDPSNTTNDVTYTEKVDKDGNIVSVSVSKGQELIPSMTGKTFDAWYLDSAFTNKAPDSIANYIKANPNEKELALHARYKDLPMLTTGYKFNKAIKSLAGASQINTVQVVKAPPLKNIITEDVSANHDGAYLVWWDGGTKTIKLYSKSGDIVLNSDSGSMFANCSSLTTLDVSNWDTSLVTDMRHMFNGCSKLTALDVSKWDTGSVTNMSGMFNNCSLTSIDVSKWNTGSVTDMNYMFSNCVSLTDLKVSNWDTSKVTNMSGMFYYCRKLTTLDVSGFDTSKVTDMSGMFNTCVALTTLDVSGWDISKVTNMSNVFSNCSKLTTLDVSKWNTGSVTNMSGMFSGCNNLTTLDISNWNTEQVTNMSYLFRACRSLTALDLSSFDTRQVTNMSGMFQGCQNFTTLDISNWNTSSVTNMRYMFESCGGLTTLDVSGWNTRQVTDMNHMFSYCSSLATLGVSKWDTSKVTDMSNMFQNCSKLATLDVSNWNTSKVTSMRYMFESCGGLKYIYIGSNWNTDNVTSSTSMFIYCSNLPNYNSGVVDKTNAHAGSGGYMTLKS